MIKQADEVKYVCDLSANISLKLATSEHVILESAKVFEERDLAQIFSCVSQV